jgi:hypothetical protein
VVLKLLEVLCAPTALKVSFLRSLKIGRRLEPTLGRREALRRDAAVNRLSIFVFPYQMA